MAWLEDTGEAQIMPGAGEIMERDPPFFMFGVGMTLVDEAVYAFSLTEIAFVILAVMFIGYFLFQLEETGQESVGII